MPQPTLDTFLAAFFPDESEAIALRFFKPKDEPNGEHNRPVKLHTTRRALSTDTALQSHLRELNRTRGAYFVVNSGGDEDKDITRRNAFFVECDETIIAEQHAAFDHAPLTPSARLETRKSVHAYFLLSGACAVADWVETQKRLIARFGGDAKNKNPSRVFRLPYFNHVHFDKETGKYEYKRVEIKYFDPTRRYTLNEMQAAFPIQADTHSQSAHGKAGSGATTTRPSDGNQTFATCSELNAELKTRIMQQAKMNGRGIYEMRGLCHNGNGETALCFNPATGKVWCNSGCAYQAILRAFGLPTHAANSNKVDDVLRPLGIVCMNDVEREEVSWLWHPFVAQGKLTIIEGEEGVGKSLLTLALTSAVSNGRGLPNIKPDEHLSASNVLLMSAEDGLGDTIRPRLESVEANLTRVFAVSERFTLDREGLLRLDDAIIKHTPALVIIDPLFAYTGGKVDIHRSNELREISTPLSDIAARHGCANVVVRHIGKAKGNGDARAAGLGGIDLRAAARSVLLVGTDPDDKRRRAIVQTKNNLAPFGEALAYTIDKGAFFWTGASDLTAARILSNVASDDERSAQTETDAFLHATLSEGARPANEVKREAAQVGLTEQNLRTARARLGIKPFKQGGEFGGKGAAWMWQLPDAQDVSDSAQDVRTNNNQHLVSNPVNKSSYSNGLAQDVSCKVSNILCDSELTSCALTDEETELSAHLEYYGASREDADRTARRMFQDVPF